ncbi:MAG TPA: DUF4349 domain-containing protein [Candidatus Limivicinus faecipullorum]|nr:DUF4349 domain-containing protein [Candidatus Limivicinus faecipullorum]
MKKTLALILTFLMLLSLCACGAASKGSDTAAATESIQEAPAAAAEDSYGGLASYSNFAADYDYAEAEEDGAGGETGAEAGEINPDKIIYSGEAEVETRDFDDSIAKLMEMLEQYGGWIESSSLSGANYYSISRGNSGNRSASYTLRIPSQHFETVMNSLSEIGNVPYTYTYSENVTTQYYDTQARLTAYETQEARLLEMMEKAETVSDVITIEEKLTELRYQIESLQSTLNNWDRQVSYSTLRVGVTEVGEYTPQPQQSYLQELWQALTGAFKNLGSFFKDFLVFLVSAIPTIIVLVVLFFIFRPIYRKVKARRKARKAGRSGEEKQDK